MLKITRRITLLSFFLMIVTALTIAICSSAVMQLEQEQTSLNPVQADGSTLTQATMETKIVSDAFGQVEIPLHPQRVVILDDHTYLDPVLALGVKPIGVMSCFNCREGFRGIPDDLVANISDIGITTQPSLEKIFYLKPDLILAYDFQKISYPQLSLIAPTVAINYFDVRNFKDRLKYFAQFFEKNNLAQEILARYESRIQELRQGLEIKMKNKTVAVIYIFYGPHQFTVYGPKELNHSQILMDAGLQFVPAQKDQKEHFKSLSVEVLPKYDADYLFIVSNSWTEANELTNLSFLKESVWSTLKAVQAKQVHLVNWDIGGTIGADRVIDDLYKYLVNAP